MSWIAVGSAAVSVVGGAIAKNQANKGANAQAEEQRLAREQARADLMPYQQFGQEAIPLLSRLNGGDYSGFLNSPDYLAARDLGQGQIDHSAAARGGLFGGGHTRDTMKFGSQLASQYLGQYRNSLFNQLGGGQNAAAGQGNASLGTAEAIGNARASAYNNNAEFAAGTAGALSGLLNQYGAQRTPSYNSAPSTSGYGSLSGMQYTAPATANGASWLNGYGASTDTERANARYL